MRSITGVTDPGYRTRELQDERSWATPARLAANKRLVAAFYDAAINQKGYDLAVTFLGPPYRQHNATAGDGAAGLKTFIEFLKAKFPTQQGDIKQIIAEGDLVARTCTPHEVMAARAAPLSIFSESQTAKSSSIGM